MLLNKLKSFFYPVAQRVAIGKVKFFNRRKGYGFIESEDVEPDIFVHVTDLEEFVSKGDRVAFRITKSKKGYEAKQVKRANS